VGFTATGTGGNREKKLVFSHFETKKTNSSTRLGQLYLFSYAVPSTAIIYGWSIGEAVQCTCQSMYQALVEKYKLLCVLP